MFARFRRYRGVKNEASKRSHHDADFSWQTINAECPNLTRRHLEFAEQKLKELKLDKYRLTQADMLSFLRLAGLNPRDEMIGEYLSTYELHDKEVWNLKDLLVIWSAYLKDTVEEQVLAQAFQFFDRDGNGVISVAEFEEVMTELGDKLEPSECKLFVSLIDKNGDGVMQYEEFLAALRKDGEEIGVPSSGQEGSSGRTYEDKDQELSVQNIESPSSIGPEVDPLGAGLGASNSGSGLPGTPLHDPPGVRPGVNPLVSEASVEESIFS